jgi:hypothetical protein
VSIHLVQEVGLKLRDGIFDHPTNAIERFSELPSGEFDLLQDYINISSSSSSMWRPGMYLAILNFASIPSFSKRLHATPFMNST